MATQSFTLQEQGFSTIFPPMIVANGSMTFIYENELYSLLTY